MRNEGQIYCQRGKESKGPEDRDIGREAGRHEDLRTEILAERQGVMRNEGQINIVREAGNREDWRTYTVHSS
jgi:hypothetical protein